MMHAPHSRALATAFPSFHLCEHVLTGKNMAYTHFTRTFINISAAIDFVKEYLGAPVGVDVDALRQTIETQQRQLEAKDAIIAELRAQLDSNA